MNKTVNSTKYVAIKSRKVKTDAKMTIGSPENLFTLD